MLRTIDLIRVGAPDVRITGTELGNVGALKSEMALGDEWSELTLLEGPDRDWILVAQGNKEGFQKAVGDYLYVQRPEIGDVEFSSFDQPTNEEEVTASMIKSVMKWLKWSRLSKDLAATLDWNVLQHVGVPVDK